MVMLDQGVRPGEAQGRCLFSHFQLSIHPLVPGTQQNFLGPSLPNKDLNQSQRFILLHRDFALQEVQRFPLAKGAMKVEFAKLMFT